MRHNIVGNRLGRFSSWRKATVRDIAKATIIHQRICTTKARAKEARKLVEHLITLGKDNTLAAKRMAFSILCDHQVVSDLFNKVARRFEHRLGGYTRIIPLPLIRRGDNASLVYLELTEKHIEEPKVKQLSAKDAKEKSPQEPVEAKKESPKMESHKVDQEEQKTQPQPHKETKEKPVVHHKDIAKSKVKPSVVTSGIKRFFSKKPSE